MKTSNPSVVLSTWISATAKKRMKTKKFQDMDSAILDAEIAMEKKELKMTEEKYKVDVQALVDKFAA